MITRQSIEITKQRIDRMFNYLQKEVLDYEKAVNQLSQNRDKLRTIVFNSNVNVLEPIGFELISTLLDASSKIKSINERRLREIDNITAIIAGYLTILLDHCLEKYNTQLKLWLKLRIERLADMREIEVDSYKEFIPFPIAVAILTPYLIKTKESDSSHNMVSIRNAINSLSELSY